MQESRSYFGKRKTDRRAVFEWGVKLLVQQGASGSWRWTKIAVSDHQRVVLLILIMTAVSGCIGIAAVGLLYRTAFEEERQHLIEIANSQARLIEAIASFDQTYSLGYPEGPREATLAQLREAHAAYEGFGRTGEFTLAQRQADFIEFILSFRHVGPDVAKRISLQSNLAEPMRRALAGRSGTLVGLDYRGVKVLAAHEPVAMLDLGIVAKLDLAEIRAPFLRAGGLVGVAALLLITIGILLFFRVSKPILQRITDSEERFRSISKAAQDAIIMINDRDQIDYWNPAAERIFGYTEAEALGKVLHEWLAPERFRADQQRASQHFAETGQGAIIGKTRKLVALRKGGEEFPMELSVSSLQLKGRWYALGVLRDITERKRAEEALRYERDFAESLIETAQIIVLVLDTEGRIVRFNRFMEQLSGYRLEEVRGQDWFSTFLPLQDRGQIRQAFQKTLADISMINQEYPILTRAGQERLIEWYNKSLNFSDGQMIGMLAIGHDITEHKAQEAQLVQAQKMEIVGQLTGGIAHDFNNLLTIILGNLDFLSSELAQEAAPEIQEPLQDALSAARDGATLTQRLLALSRRQALHPSVVGLDKVIQHLKKFLRRILGESFDLQVNTPDDPLTVFADPSRLENTLLNVIINARDAMPRGGTLTIDIFRETVAPTEVTSSSLSAGSYAVVRITDTGTGMSAEVLSHAIDPFFTTKTSGKGTGLGLSMVYNFAKQSAGDLRLQSQPGIGTSVSLVLPEAEPLQGDEDTEIDLKLESLPCGSETILVVEDEPRVRKLLARRLSNLGYRVIEAENAKSARQLIESQTEVDLLFSDIVMPGDMDGYDLVHWARERRPELKLLLTTGAESEQAISRRSTIDQGMPILRKPYTEKMLCETVRSLLNGSTRAKLS